MKSRPVGQFLRKQIGLRVVILLACVLILQAPPVASTAELTKVFPGKDWERVAKPETVGYDSARLDALRTWLKTNRTTAMLVSVGGRSLFEYGDLTRVSKIASVRKSILAMLYGKYVVAGTIDLDKNVKQLGLEDVEPFLPIEEHATLHQLLTARSGIYLPTGNTDLNERLPRRGSHLPGTYFQYSNWDFNAAGTAFEKLTEKNIYDALESDLARPIGMQDFDRSRQRKISALPHSVHPEYAMYLSTRDMARLGLLILRSGAWQEKQLIPAEWCNSIVTLVTPPTDLHPTGLNLLTVSRRWGYGILWWVWDAPVWPNVVTGPYQGAYSAMGANGQYITVLPALDMVIAHKVDIDDDESREVQPNEFDAILQMVVASAARRSSSR